MENQSLEKLNKKYRIIAKLGDGGMGSVHHCKRLSDDKDVAIKIIKTGCTEVEKLRFRNEVKAMRSINSQYVVKYYEAEFEEDERWIAMEYVQGSVLKRMIKKNGYLQTELAINFAKMIVQGLVDIHRAGIVHRDLKSSNIIVSDNSNIKIIDFGIALDEVTPRYTQTGKVIGTPEYIAPELINKTAGPSAQSDIYSFGILLYEMLEGTSPFSGGVKAQLLSHSNDEIPKLTRINVTVPQSVQNIINKCCAKNPTDRYEDAYALYQDLSTCLNPEKVFEKPVDYNKKNKGSKISKINSKKFWIAIISVSAIILVTALIMLIIEVSGKK
ncbi:serine/threonine-protein kinase [[Mycoplasma] gypis]|uniref:mitogen-activated protein kinase kinase n=1 Tax=[Mycoplasma] gypis TaxID=92404 RepID=A0ABZ2RMF2_9BACT|nr:serine/threonine-protein kinase [[Mycoplasma] gypis]MBN0919114.1 serine/threonine protein kinase [[Mycoplasma] gypis]